jgi:hypothetical protein
MDKITKYTCAYVFGLAYFICSLQECHSNYNIIYAFIKHILPNGSEKAKLSYVIFEHYV